MILVKGVVIKRAISITIDGDILDFVEIVAHQRQLKVSNTINFLLRQYISELRKKAQEKQKQAREEIKSKKDLEETIYHYQQGKPIKEQPNTEVKK